jgi:hypothetical protein
MKVETLGWTVIVVLGVFAVVLWSRLPLPALIICAVVVIIVAAKILLGRRM